MSASTDDAAIAGAFRRPFEEQLAFWRGKLANLVPTARWDDIWKSAHDRAFMVAGAAKADLLADLAAAVDKAVAEGETLDAFRRRFDEIVRRHGWRGWTGEGSQAGRAWRTRIIYQTNLATSYAAGRLAQLREAGFALWVYRHSGAEHPRLQHLAWDGLTLPADHPFWQTHYPPSGWNCFPRETVVRCSARLGHRMFYRGEVVELHTRGGNQLTLTVNHPVLTCQGWVAAGQLEAGDEVLTATLDGDTALHGVIDDPEPPARAEDLFQALAAQGLRVIPVTPHDFHGDALGAEGEVHIAGADGVLMDVIEAELRHDGGKLRLDAALAGWVEAADHALGATQEAFVGEDAVFAQNPADGGLGDAQTPGDTGLTGQAAAVEREHLALDLGVSVVGHDPGAPHDALAPVGGLALDDPARAHAGRAITRRDAAGDQQPAQRTAAHAALARQLLEAHAGKVTRDEIVGIRKFQWSDHVYDFTTTTGMIVAGGIIVSNCRCRVVGANGPEGAKLLGGKPGYTEPPAGWDAIDPKTGEPPGIDRGWGYMPGNTADLVRQIERKTASMPAPLAQALRDDIETQQAVGWVVAQGMREGDIEYAVAIRDGQTVLRKRGGASHVSFSDAELASMRGATLVHNHPSSSSLSRADLYLTANFALGEIVAAGHDGSQYRARVVSVTDLLRYYDVADRHAYQRISAMVRAGSVSTAEAEHWHNHAVNEGLARAGIIEYRASALPAEPAWVNTVAAVIEENIARLRQITGG